MTIDEAINMLERITAQDDESGRPECVEAEKLGIEALKRIRHYRKWGAMATNFDLPGETKD